MFEKKTSLGVPGLIDINTTLAPFYLLSYFFIDAIVNGHFINFFIYLFTLSIAMSIGLLFKKQLNIKAPIGFGTNPICNSFESPWFRELENLIVPSFRSLFFSFTTIYMFCGVVSNPIENTNGIVFLILLIFISIADIIIRKKNYCENNTSILWGVILGFLIGWLSWGIVKLLGGSKFLYFANNDQHHKQCKLNNKKIKFKCTTGGIS